MYSRGHRTFFSDTLFHIWQYPEAAEGDEGYYYEYPYYEEENDKTPTVKPAQANVEEAVRPQPDFEEVRQPPMSHVT